jgi:hypothetical protein
VFGIRNEVPTYTYVDRAGLDKKLEYLLGADRHIVIHGASKQGKSSLRRKVIEPGRAVVIQCLPEMTGSNVITAALRELDSSVPSGSSKSETGSRGISVSAKAEAKLPLFGSGNLAGEGTMEKASEEGRQFVAVPGYDTDLSFLSKRVKELNRKIVLEDFHYFNEETRKDLSFKLKALYELGIYVIVVGIWAEQNLLTYYNGDLSGRVEELDISWSDYELLEVLEKGADALNIGFSGDIATRIISSSFANVGLTQRLAERLCIEDDVLEKQAERKTLQDATKFQNAQSAIVADLHQRYTRIAEVFDRGFQDTELKVYYHLFHAITEWPTEQLVKGIPQDKLLEKLESYESKIRGSDLTAALSRIERLQSSRGVTPLLVSYNNNLRSISLADREFLFYREYGKPDWPWMRQA